MKFKFVLLLCFLVQSYQLSAQSKEVKFLIDTSITIMKQNSVNTKTVNWKKVRKDTYKKAAGINNPADLGPVFSFLFQSIDDFHGDFRYNGNIFKWHHNEPVADDSIIAEQRVKRVRAMVLEDNIGYMLIPSMPGEDKVGADKRAQYMSDLLCGLLQKNIKGMILDLRSNGGGSMFPMIAGVKQLLGNGKIGAFNIDSKTEEWFIKGNNFTVNNVALASAVPQCDINAENIPLVILTSGSTGSSGEFVILAFKGRKNTVLLGSETAGYVTSARGWNINKDASIRLSTGYGLDRNGIKYTKAIQPDIPITGINRFHDLGNDEKVKAAIKWLKQHFN